MVHHGRCNATLLAPPRHHGSCRSKSAFQNLVPTDNLAAMLSQEFFNTLNEIALQLFFSRMVLVGKQFFFTDALLAERTFSPACFRAFVTADMDIFAREKFHHFLQHIFKKLKSAFLSCTQNNVLNTPDIADNPLFALARQFRISSNRSHFVTRHFDFRYHCNKSFGCIFHNFLHLFLRIVAAIFMAFAFNTLRTDFRQFRVFLDFYSPTLVFRQVPVHTVDFIHRHHVKLLFHLVDCHKMAARVEVNTAIRKTRLVGNAHIRSRPFDTVHLFAAFNFSRQELHETLHTVKQSLRSFCRNIHTILPHFQTIAFAVHFHLRVKCQTDVTAILHIEVIAGRAFHFFHKIFSHFLCFRSSRPDFRASFQREFPIADSQTGRGRNHVHAFVVGFFLAACTARSHANSYDSTGKRIK